MQTEPPLINCQKLLGGHWMVHEAFWNLPAVVLPVQPTEHGIQVDLGFMVGAYDPNGHGMQSTDCVDSGKCREST